MFFSSNVAFFVMPRAIVRLDKSKKIDCLLKIRPNSNIKMMKFGNNSGLFLDKLKKKSIIKKV